MLTWDHRLAADRTCTRCDRQCPTTEPMSTIRGFPICLGHRTLEPSQWPTVAATGGRAVPEEASFGRRATSFLLWYCCFYFFIFRLSILSTMVRKFKVLYKSQELFSSNQSRPTSTSGLDVQTKQQWTLRRTCARDLYTNLVHTPYRIRSPSGLLREQETNVCLQDWIIFLTLSLIACYNADRRTVKFRRRGIFRAIKL